MTRDYELGFILNPEVSEEQTRAILNRVEQIVASHDGQIVRVQQWGRRRLAYPIEHHRDGFYIFIDMILTPETVSELERTLKVSEIVLRYMTRRRDPRAVQQEREARANAAANAPAPAPAPEASEVSEVQPTEAQDQQEQPEAQGEQVEQVEQVEQEAPVQETEQAQPVSEQPATPVETATADVSDVPPASDAPETIEA